LSKSDLKLVCNVNIVHGADVLLSCTTVLYPKYVERKGAMNSSMDLHSCHLVTYKQR
jgi:hypothetical protein